MMRKNLLARSLVCFLLVAAGLALPMNAVDAAPALQDWEILVIGWVDVAGGDPANPGCNGVNDPEDENFANSDPLPAMDFVVRDAGGNQVANGTTSALSFFQTATLMVPPDQDYELELVADPTGWQLCETESRIRTLAAADFQLGGTREDFHFRKAGTGPTEPPPTETPTDETPPPPTETVGPGTDAPPPATSTPRPPGDDDDDKDDAPKPSAPLGQIRGLAFIDLNADGLLGPSEPGLNDVVVHLHGGGLQLSQTTPSVGTFNFAGLGIGEYDVFIDPGSEWVVTTSRRYSNVRVNGNDVQGIDFGLIRVGDYERITGSAPAQAVVPMPGAGIRLPSTGIADLPTSSLLGVVTLVLGALAVLGYQSERRGRDD